MEESQIDLSKLPDKIISAFIMTFLKNLNLILHFKFFKEVK